MYTSDDKRGLMPPWTGSVTTMYKCVQAKMGYEGDVYEEPALV